MMPTRVVNSRLMACEMSFSTSVRTFCRTPSVSPPPLGLFFEHLNRQRQRVADAVCEDLGAQPLRDDVDEVVLEVLGHTRDERDAYGRQQQHADAAEELRGRIELVLRRVAIDDVAEDQRIEQREDLVDGRQDQARGRRARRYRLR